MVAKVIPSRKSQRVGSLVLRSIILSLCLNLEAEKEVIHPFYSSQHKYLFSGWKWWLSLQNMFINTNCFQHLFLTVKSPCANKG